MYRKSYLIILCGLVVHILLAGCFEDKGNYDYKELDRVVIDTIGLGMQPVYVLARYDVLSLNPDIYFNGKLIQQDEEEPALSYLWTIYTTVTSAYSDYQVDTLGYSRHLEKAITRQAGGYYVRLTITNHNDQTKQFFKVTCNVEESITAGWMVFYEPSGEPGTSDVGLVVNSWVRKNIIKEREFFGLYKASNGKTLEGTPLRVLHTNVSMTNDEIILLTNKEMVGVNQGAFVRVLDFSDFFYEEPSVQKTTYYGVGGTAQRSEMLINDNKVYNNLFNSMQLARTNFFGVPYRGEHGEIAPWGSDVHGTAYTVVSYDQTNECFIRVSGSNVNFSSFAEQDPGCAFNVNQVGAKLLMGDWGRSYYDYMLMRKENSYYLAIANFTGANAAINNVGLGWYDVSASPGINAATTIAAAYQGEYVLYGAGSSVYNLKYNASTQAGVLWTAPSGEVVTCVRLQKYYFGTLFMAIMPNPNALLHVSTWNEVQKEGKLYQFQINPADGAIKSDSEPKIYNVPGKIIDMAWKKAMEQ